MKSIKKCARLWLTLNIFLFFVCLFVSVVSGSVSISIFASLVDIPVGIASPAIGLKICALTAGSKNYRSIIKKKKDSRNQVKYYQSFDF